MAVWDPYLSEQDRAVIEASGYGAFLGPGRRPALIVIDVTYSFTGEKREPILDSIRKWHFSCGPKAWDAIPHIQRLLSAARSRNLPIFYSHGYDIRPDGFGKGLWRTTRLTECDPVGTAMNRNSSFRRWPRSRATSLLPRPAPASFLAHRWTLISILWNVTQ